MRRDDTRKGCWGIVLTIAQHPSCSFSFGADTGATGDGWGAGILDKVANRCLAQGTNAWTDVDHTAYTVTTAGAEGLLNLLPIYLDHLLHPTLTDEGFTTEVRAAAGRRRRRRAARIVVVATAPRASSSSSSGVLCTRVASVGRVLFGRLLPRHALLRARLSSRLMTERPSLRSKVHHVTGEGEDKGVVYCEMQGRENDGGSLTDRACLDLLYPDPGCGYASEASRDRARAVPRIAAVSCISPPPPSRVMSRAEIARRT